MATYNGRCGLCRARGIQQTERVLQFGQIEKKFLLECSHCGMLYDDLETATGEAFLFKTNDIAMCTPSQKSGFDMFTLRILAARFGYAAVPSDSFQAEALLRPHSSLAGTANIIPLENVVAAPMTLGIMCREHELPSVLHKFEAFNGEFMECLVVVDQPSQWTASVEIPRHCKVVTRQLDRDFGSQRNFIQELSRTDWVLQLDADEDLSIGSVRKLRRLATLADQQQIVSIGLMRKNFVGSCLSDLYPDVQYRLNRSTVRYEGTVHERPDRPWQKSMIATGMDIDHMLEKAHVDRRSKLYDDISPGNGRLEEENTLKASYRPD